LRRYFETAQEALFGQGWASRLAASLRLQGQLHIDRREILIRRGHLAEPLRIAFASDLHAGPLTCPQLFAAMAEAINGFQPHVILFGGDYVSYHHRDLLLLTEYLSRLRAPLGVFGVLGNHDLWADDAEVVAGLSKAGVHLLVNQAHAFADPFAQVRLFGLDEPGTGNPDTSTFPSEPDAIRIVLMHSPLGLSRLQGLPWDIALCGHTHGGQIALPGGIPIILPHGSGARRRAHGCHDLTSDGGGTLLVSRGVGMSDLPIRLFAPSEVHLCTVRSDME
jgi:uncharacterized protein